MPPFCFGAGAVPRRGREPDPSALRDRNTVAMVARHFGVSPSTIHRWLADGALGCMRLYGVIRIARDQVEEFERRTTVGPKEQKAHEEGARKRALDRALRTALRQRIAGKPRAEIERS
jgi:hypothetical protein